MKLFQFINLGKVAMYLGGITLALLGIMKPDIFSPPMQKFLDQPITVALARLIGFFMGYAVIVLAVFDVSKRLLSEQIKKSSDERDQKLLIKDQEIQVLHQQLRDRDRLRQLDTVTGIPNQLKWEKDVLDLSKTDDPDPHYQMIIIDLDNFRKINGTYGYEKGDRVIKEFARTIFNSMRRDEHVYKNLIRRENGTPIKSEELWERFYRKYTGGDEFLLTINGEQHEALGFLVRLVRDLLPRINERISEFILDSRIDLAFHAGMCEWYLGDEPRDVLLRLEGALRIAVNSSKSRLYCDPPMSPDEFERRVKQSTGTAPRFNPYRDAERVFAKPAT